MMKKQHQHFTVCVNYIALEEAYRVLIDIEKRNIYTSVIKEANERVLAERAKVNKKTIPGDAPITRRYTASTNFRNRKNSNREEKEGHLQRGTRIRQKGKG